MKTNLVHRVVAVAAGLAVAFTCMASKSMDVPLSGAAPTDALMFFVGLGGLLVAMWGMFAFSSEKTDPIPQRIYDLVPTILACSMMMIWLSKNSAMAYLWAGLFFMVFASIPVISKHVGERMAKAMARSRPGKNK